jgi:hypothetical protein
MTDLRRRDAPAWMDGLTPDETLDINRIDERCAAIDHERKELTRKRCLIQQRANQRVLYRKRAEAGDV